MEFSLRLFGDHGWLCSRFTRARRYLRRQQSPSFSSLCMRFSLAPLQHSRLLPCTHHFDIYSGEERQDHPLEATRLRRAPQLKRDANWWGGREQTPGGAYLVFRESSVLVTMASEIGRNGKPEFRPSSRRLARRLTDLALVYSGGHRGIFLRNCSAFREPRTEWLQLERAA